MGSNKAYAEVVVLAVVACFALLTPGLKLPAFLQKKPATAQLDAAQLRLDEALKAKSEAEAKLAAIVAAEAAAKESQSRYSQQMVEGADLALATVVDRTPAINAAAGFVGRARVGLGAALGPLPKDKQVEIQAIFDGLIAERDEARKALEDKDAELRIVTKERASLVAQKSELEKKVVTASAAVEVQEATVKAKVAEVENWAKAKAAADAEAGSLKGYLDWAIKGFALLAALYVAVHFVLPSLAQEFPAVRALNVANAAIKSVFSAHQ